MAKLNFTAAALKAHFDKNPTAVLYDEGQRGGAAYRTSAGHISLMAHYRIGHRQAKKTIGRLGELSISEFRAKVAALVLAGKEGVNTIADRKREAERAVTLLEIHEQHTESMKRRRCSPASLAVNVGTFRTRLAKHGSRTLASITKAEVRSWTHQWRAAGPCAANRAIRLLSTLFNFAIKKTDAPLLGNPCQAVDMWPERLKRDVLPFDALPEWWAAVNAIANPSHRAYFKLLLFTGLRRMDAASIKVEDIHGDHIFRGNPKGGAKKSFQCPRTPALDQILAEALQARETMSPRSAYLFPASIGHGHFRGTWHDQIELQGIAVTPHVLRRTYASAALASGVGFLHIRALLNHVGGGSVTETSYLRIPLEERLTAACKVAEFLETKIVGALPQPVKLLEFQGDLPEENAAA